MAQMDKDGLLADIRKAKQASGRSEFLDRFENEVVTWKDLSNDGELQKRVSSLLKLNRYLIGAYPHDFNTQLRAVSGLLLISYNMQTLEMDYLPVRQEAIHATEALARRFPKEDRAHAQLGHVLATSDENRNQEARLQFEKCLELNSTNQYCREYLSRLSGG